jgi:ATP-dependent RNA helicase RhlE
MQNDSFKSLSLHPRLLQALVDEGYTEPTPIQRQAIPLLLEGKDLLATAQTGTGKTAAFALPTLQLLHEGAQALILTPTRELAMQIEDSFRRYGQHVPLRAAVIVGGVSQHPQVKAIKNKPDIVVATPGRLLDLMRQRVLRLDRVEILILDEADRMLDMGFIDDVKKIVSRVPRPRQTMFFSATLSNEVLSLASGMLDNPEEVAVAPPATIADSIEQQVMFVAQTHKRALLTHVLNQDNIKRALVFTRTKREADRVVQHVMADGISADAIHSDKNQAARVRALASFSTGKVRVLVATDVMARGIDVDDITHVINYDLPSTPDNYVHRIGRTARAGAEGIALSLCEASEVPQLNDIKNQTGTSIEMIETQPYHSAAVAMLYCGNSRKSTSKARSGWRSFRPRGARMMR